MSDTTSQNQILRPILHIDEEKCNGCGLCLPSCAEGALRIENGKARIIADKLCDGLGNCLNNCPRGALRIENRVADTYDHRAVEAALGRKLPNPPGGCPGSAPASASDNDAEACYAPESGPDPQPGQAMLSSADKHWPLKLHLVPLKAEFLRNADLLLTADCAALAATNFSGRYLRGKTGLLLCPKLESKDEIAAKLAAVLQQCHPKSITLARMEVPCCCIPDLLRRAVDLCEDKAAASAIPVKTIVLNRFGREKMPGLGLSPQSQPAPRRDSAPVPRPAAALAKLPGADSRNGDHE